MTAEPGQENPFESPRVSPQQKSAPVRLPPVLVLFTSSLMLALGVFHAVAWYRDSIPDHGLLAAISCLVAVLILLRPRVCWFLGLLGGAGLAFYQFLICATTYLEVPWSVRFLGTPLLVGHLGSVLLLLLLQRYFPVPNRGSSKPSE